MTVYATPAERTLFLHIGQGKTGSSYLQSCAARSRATLAAAGYDYLWHDSLGPARRGAVTSGNARFLSRALMGRLADWIPPRMTEARLRRAEGHVVLSSEGLINVLLSPGARERLLRLAARAGFGRIAVLLFIRDPFEHLASQHQQGIKREGRTAEINASARVFGAPMQAASLVRLYGDAPGLALTVLNYSRRRGALVEAFEAWLGLPPETLNPPPRKVVNRTLTLAELEVQRLLNERLGPSARLAADPLMEHLPDLRGVHPRPGPVAAAGLADRLRPAMEAVNRFVGAGEAYRLDLPPPAAPVERLKTYELSDRQLEVIVDAIAAEIRRRPLRL